MKFFAGFLVALLAFAFFGGRCGPSTPIPPGLWTWALTTGGALTVIAIGLIFVCSLPRAR